MSDIVDSLNRALLRQKWIFGERWARIGHPFVWVDHPFVRANADIGGADGFDGPSGIVAVRSYISMFYERYETPEAIRTDDHEDVRQHIEYKLRELSAGLMPFLPITGDLENNIVCTALARAQDYSFIKTFATDLPESVDHLDIGPGLGSHAMYSLGALKSRYMGLEASPLSYAVQRHVFRSIAPAPGDYLDPIECENFGLDYAALEEQLNSDNSYRIKHLPSWHAPLVNSDSIDLVTASFMLNEVTYSGILWLLSHASRLLRKGGFFYIRDSSKLKPGRHSINYDHVLVDLGFVEVGRLDVRNRVDFYGIPRIYRKQSEAAPSFDELVDRYLGRFALVSIGGEYDQNLDLLPGVAQQPPA